MSAIFKRHGVRNRMQLLLTTTKGQQVVLLPIEIEQQPVVWAHLHGDTIKGIVFSKECPKEGWEPLYRKVQK